MPKKKLERESLPDERKSFTHEFRLPSQRGRVSFCLTCGTYPDGRLGEISIRTGDPDFFSLRCALETWATAVSLGLQYGIPLEAYLEKARHTSFEPAGRPSFPVITPSLGATPSGAVTVEPEADDRKVAKSVVDYVARFLGRRFSLENPNR